jgi:hypothetical protein
MVIGIWMLLPAALEVGGLALRACPRSWTAALAKTGAVTVTLRPLQSPRSQTGTGSKCQSHCCKCRSEYPMFDRWSVETKKPLSPAAFHRSQQYQSAA